MLHEVILYVKTIFTHCRQMNSWYVLGRSPIFFDRRKFLMKGNPTNKQIVALVGVYYYRLVGTYSIFH